MPFDALLMQMFLGLAKRAQLKWLSTLAGGPRRKPWASLLICHRLGSRAWQRDRNGWLSEEYLVSPQRTERRRVNRSHNLHTPNGSLSPANISLFAWFCASRSSMPVFHNFQYNNYFQNPTGPRDSTGLLPA